MIPFLIVLAFLTGWCLWRIPRQAREVRNLGREVGREMTSRGYRQVTRIKPTSAPGVPWSQTSWEEE